MVKVMSYAYTCGEVTSYDVIVITRRNVGIILNMNKDGRKMRTTANTYSMVINRVFRLA